MSKREYELIDDEQEQPVDPVTDLIRKLDKESREKREKEKKSFIKSDNFNSTPFNLDSGSAVVDHPFKRSKRILKFATSRGEVEKITNDLSNTKLDETFAPSRYKQPRP